jgi:hypothetical protein
LGGRACGRGGTLAGGDHLTGPAPTMLGCAGTAVEYGIGGVAATWFSAYAGACMTLDSWPDGNSGRPGRLAPGRRSGRPGGWLIAVRREGNSVPHSRADHALAGKGVRVIAGAAGGPLATGGIERAPLEDRPHPRAPGARSRPPRLDQDGAKHKKVRRWCQPSTGTPELISRYQPVKHQPDQHIAGRSPLPEICQKQCLDTPYTAPCPLSQPQPLSCDVVVARGVLRRCAWYPHSLSHGRSRWFEPNHAHGSGGSLVLCPSGGAAGDVEPKRPWDALQLHGADLGEHHRPTVRRVDDLLAD